MKDLKNILGINKKPLGVILGAEEEPKTLEELLGVSSVSQQTRSDVAPE